MNKFPLRPSQNTPGLAQAFWPHLPQCTSDWRVHCCDGSKTQRQNCEYNETPIEDISAELFTAAVCGPERSPAQRGRSPSQGVSSTFQGCICHQGESEMRGVLHTYMHVLFPLYLTHACLFKVEFSVRVPSVLRKTAIALQKSTRRHSWRSSSKAVRGFLSSAFDD